MIANACVVLQNVSKTYRRNSGPGYPALRDVSLVVERGDCVALVGASGSGKTTILNLVGGVDTPDSGSITVEGVSLDRMTDDDLSAFRLRRIGYVFQSFNLLPHLTVEENVAVPLLLDGVSGRQAAERARVRLADVGMETLAARRPYELSGGEMQRVAIARAMVHEPALILADEPTGNLDSVTGDRILDLMRQLNREKGITFLIATHSERCRDMARRVIHIRDGQRVADPAEAGG